MIADDQTLVRETLADMIGAIGPYRIVLCTGETNRLLAAAERDAPSIAIIDARMPEAMHAVRHMSLHCRDTRLILLDEFPAEANLWGGLDGTFGYVTKCDSSAQFAAVLARVAAGERILPAEWQRVIHTADDKESAIAFDSGQPSPALLTARELEVLARLSEGLSVRACAARLGISTNTVDNHKARIMQKLRIHKTVELARFAIRHGLVADC